MILSSLFEHQFDFVHLSYKRRRNKQLISTTKKPQITFIACVIRTTFFKYDSKKVIWIFRQLDFEECTDTLTEHLVSKDLGPGLSNNLSSLDNI